MSSIYKEMLDKMIFSFSTLHQYETCPYSFYLKKIENEKGITNSLAEIGSYSHDLFAQIFGKKISAEKALEKCVEEFEDNINEYISETSLNKKFNALCNYLSDLDIDNFFEKYDVLGVEKKFMWEIDKHPMIGFADLILKRKEDGGIILVDHKSSGHFMQKDGKTPLKNQLENLITYKKQMYLYADAMKKTMGFYPDLIVWNHFLDDGKKSVIVFDKTELDNSLIWAKNIIKMIYSDESFIDKQTYFMCNVLCEYRDICEYKDDDNE